MVRAVFVAGARRRPPHRPARWRRARSRSMRACSEVERDAPAELEAIAADELLLLATFLRRPAPELRVVPLERDAILAAANGVALAA